MKALLTRVKGAVQRWRMGRARVAILMYHRVTELVPGVPHRLCVSPGRFEEHLRVLSGRAVHLEDVLGRDKCMAVTFDDGYEDNLHAAKPLLERYGIPATVFVSSGFVGKDEPFWWESLQEIVLRTTWLPETLQWNGRSWVVGPDPAERQELYRQLHRMVRAMRPQDQSAALKALWQWSGGKRPVAARGRIVTQPELVELASGEMVRVGAHTVSHANLTALAPAERTAELRDCRRALEQMTGKPVQTVSYPYGLFDRGTLAAAGEAGFACGCGGSGAVRRGSDPLALPRFHVEDWSGEELARRLKQWLET